jgi:polysaccharide biosynthesis transport protein
MDHLKHRNSSVVHSLPPPTSLVRSNNQIANQGVPEVQGDNSDGLIEYWHILRRNKKTILFGCLAGLILGFGAGIPTKPVYRSTTTVEVLALNGDYMNMRQASPTTTSEGSYSDTSEEETQAKLLQSTHLIERVIARLDPNSAGSDRPSRPVSNAPWRDWVSFAQPTQIRPRLKLLNQAAASIKVRPASHTRVIEVTVDSTDPQVACDFANTLTSEFISQNMEARLSSIEHSSEWLKKELNDARDKLRQSEDALQKYAKSSGLIFTDESTNIATEKLQQLQQNLSAATADRMAKQSRYELARNALPNTLGDVLSDPTLRDTSSQIDDLTRQIADLSAVYSPEYSKVRRLQAELDALLPVFARQRSDIVARIGNDYTDANRRENLASLAYDVQIHEVTGQDEKTIQYNILKRDVDSNRQLYDAMLQQMKQTSIISAMRASNVRVVDPASVPRTPFSPNFRMNSAIGLFAGLFLSIVLVTVLERADRAIRQPGDIKLWTDMLELGVIPTNSPATRRPSADGFIESLAFQSNPSTAAEAFRSVLTSILFGGQATELPRVLVFTSANAGEGKTTVTSNIAVAAAEIRMRVLLIDADLRRPRMHDIFGLDNSRGLSDILRGPADEVDLSGQIKNTDVTNLSVITAGSSSHSAGHLLYSPMWGALLDKCRSKYDMILIDTPPMLQMTDARVAARFADSVILVGRSGETTRDAMVAAKERLFEDGIPVLGAVLNVWDPKTSPGGYYGYYSSSYYKNSNYLKA